MQHLEWVKESLLSAITFISG